MFNDLIGKNLRILCEDENGNDVERDLHVVRIIGAEILVTAENGELEYLKMPTKSSFA